MAPRETRTFLSRSPAATRSLGESLGRLLPPGSVVALDGDLGSGKTCLVQGLAAGLGIPDPVTSPTYALLQTYSGRLELYHFDAYMEGRERALLQDGGLEWMHAGGIAAVEWARRVEDVLPVPRLAIRLEHVGRNERRLVVTVEGEGADADRLARIVAGDFTKIVAEGELEEIR